MLVIEDGTGVAGANSFGTVEELIDYAKLRNTVITEDEAPGLLIDAMDYIWTLCLSGDQMFELPFPRTSWPGIPPRVKAAQLQLGLDRKRGVVLVKSASAEQIVKREKVGPIDTEFFAPGETGNASAVQVPIASAALYPFTCDAEPFPAFRTRRV